jgi:tRNA-dihydrouridine synthase A
LKYVDGVMIGRASYDNPFMLSDVDEVIYKTQAIKKDKLEILNEYVDYILVMEKKGYDLSRMLKHLFGLSKGDENAKLFRKRVHEIMIEGNLQDNRNKLIELIN